MDFKDFPWTHYSVKFAILFGSWVTGKVIKGDSLLLKLASRGVIVDVYEFVSANDPTFS